jgi:hypothetical protein
MAQFSFTFGLKQSNATIEKNILKALKPEVDQYFRSVLDKINSKLSNIVIEAIKSSPEYSSLISGNLKAEFGIPDSASRLQSILDFWKNISFSYKNTKITNGGLQAKIVLNMIKSNYSDVLALDASSFVTEKRTRLNWLEWLLLFGKKTIVKDYSVVLGPSPISRTGMALMRGVKNGKWSVPAEFSGTKNNNWITRAIDSVDDKINNLLFESLKP